MIREYNIDEKRVGIQLVRCVDNRYNRTRVYSVYIRALAFASPHALNFQRHACEDSIYIDLYFLRVCRYSFLKRQIILHSTIDHVDERASGRVRDSIPLLYYGLSQSIDDI